MEVLIIGILIFGSIIGLALIIERGFALRWSKVVPPEVTDAVENFTGPKDVATFRAVCHQHPSPMSRLLLFAEEHRNWSKGDNIEVLQTRARHELIGLERGLVILEIIVGVAPLLGLVGTIYGLIILFAGANIGVTTADSGHVAKGIAVALNATLLGLLTAIPSLIAWSYYTRKVEAFAVEMERLCGEFLRKYYRKKTTDAVSI